MDIELLKKFRYEYNRTIDLILEKRNVNLTGEDGLKVLQLENEYKRLAKELNDMLTNSFNTILSPIAKQKRQKLQNVKEQYLMTKGEYETKKIIKAIENSYKVTQEMTENISETESVILIKELLTILAEVKKEYIENRNAMPEILSTIEDKCIDINKISSLDLQISIIIYSLDNNNYDINYCTHKILNMVKNNNLLYYGTIYINNIISIISGEYKEVSDDNSYGGPTQR